jgi:hypothetical protein
LDGSSLVLYSDANGYFGIPKLPIGRATVGLLSRSANSVGVVSGLEVVVQQGMVQRLPDVVMP